MFGLPIGLIIRGVLVLAIASACWYAWHRFTEHYVDKGRAEVQVKWDKDKAERIAATTAMTMLWDGKRQEAEKASAERDQLRNERNEPVASAARSLPVAVAGFHFPGAAVGVLNAGANSANAAGTPGKPQEAAAASTASADSTVGRITSWTVVVLDILSECRDRVAEWESFYNGLRAAQQGAKQ